MIRKSLLAGVVAMLVVPALAGCEAGLDAPTLQFHQAGAGTYKDVNGISISNAFVLAAPNGSSLPAGSQASLFLGLFNNNASGDQLVGVATSVSKSVTIPGSSVSLPGNQGVNLTGPQPEIVLNGLTQSLTGGQEVQVELDFAKAGQVDLSVPVEPQSFAYSTLNQPTATPSASVGATPTVAPTPSQTPTASTNPKK